MANTVNDTVKLAEKLMNDTKRRHNDQLLQELNDKKLRDSNKLAREQAEAEQVKEGVDRWNKFLEKAKKRENQEQDNRKNLIDSICK